MKLKSLLLAGALAIATSAASAEDYPMDFKAVPVTRQLAKVDQGIAKGPFKADWDSLTAYKIPNWFRNAKFGIFIHWGPYSVPAFQTEWYSRNMYEPRSPIYTYHKNVFGPQSKFGYKDFIPLFKAEKFDPGAWIALFQAAGARYVVPVAEHCDGFPMYDSDMSDWTAAKMGPKRDIAGELMKAARAKGMHFGLSSHRAEHWWWYNVGRQSGGDVSDPRYAGLYGPAAPQTLPADTPGSEPNPSHLENWNPPSKQFLDDWLARTTEIVDKYHPELIYLDWWTMAPGFEPYLRKLAAYYYDSAKRDGYGPGITYKGEHFAANSAIVDVERGKLDALRLIPWQTDTSVSTKSWGYIQDDDYRTPKSLIQDLVDIVSKNGNLLLNIGPEPDGTIPEGEREVLLGIGQWLKVNGEAIYDTRPWKYFGEGPTIVAAGEKREVTKAAWTPADIRFTTREGRLYALGLERPKNGAVLIKTLFAGSPYLDHAIAKVELLGADAPVQWRQTARGLEVTLPADPGATMPYALRISFAA